MDDKAYILRDTGVLKAKYIGESLRLQFEHDMHLIHLPDIRILCGVINRDVYALSCVTGDFKAWYLCDSVDNMREEITYCYQIHNVHNGLRWKFATSEISHICDTIVGRSHQGVEPFWRTLSASSVDTPENSCTMNS